MQAWQNSKKNLRTDTYDEVRVDDNLLYLRERDALRISVLPARGGTVVQFHAFNEKLAENKYHTYVISEGELLSQRIAEIISMEMLAR